MILSGQMPKFCETQNLHPTLCVSKRGEVTLMLTLTNLIVVANSVLKNLFSYCVLEPMSKIQCAVWQ